ncbi:hypothetical protein [Brevibacillus sp. NRS-1366]|uniref:hypothetical protein n=1 Tax=Brevibacillus sp. NRS-1366 TaxID=3233899 RepID=UPI003D1CDF7B
MNCQAFRKAWLDLDDTDSELLSHIETCEDCIVWIETQMTTEEEVQFLKEVPLPQANLEERIMQAIYQSAGQNTPPHAAAVSLQPPTTRGRRTKGFPSFAWVSAAAVLLAIGFMSYQQLNSDQLETASQSASNQAAGSNPAVAYSTSEQAPAPTASPETASQRSTVQSDTPALQAPVENQEKVLAQAEPQAAPVQSKAAVAPLDGAIAMEKPQTKVAPPEAARAISKEERTPMAARGGSEKPAADTTANKQTALSVESKDKQSVETSTHADSSQTISDQPVFGITASSVPEADANANASKENALVGPTLPMAAKQQITLSTFTDVETAVQASDMPVPVLATATNGFTMGDISIQYESETSQKVAHLSADYKRNKDWIKVEVVRNTQGKRSLSIPGTFSATQLFSINGEQAIAVSYDQHGTKDSTVQHAVHFNANANNQSLYVVLTAHGVQLDELIDASKQLTWKP